MDYIKINAPAKINLTLDIFSKREDGYHEIETIMMPINLFDVISLKKNKSNIISITSNNKKIPKDKKNICYNIAKDFFNHTKADFTGLNIDIENIIPNEAGLGGGSADSAATLIGLNRIFKTNLDEEILIDLGKKSGCDIPFCIKRKTCLAKGRGEILKEIKTSLDFSILILKAKISSSTKIAYDNFSKKDILKRPNNLEALKALQNNDLDLLVKNLVNVFEEIIEIEEIEVIKNQIIEKGALGSSMSGSGTAVFGIFDDSEKAKEAYDYFLRNKNYKTFLTSPYYDV